MGKWSFEPLDHWIEFFPPKFWTKPGWTQIWFLGCLGRRFDTFSGSKSQMSFFLYQVIQQGCWTGKSRKSQDYQESLNWDSFSPTGLLKLNGVGFKWFQSYHPFIVRITADLDDRALSENSTAEYCEVTSRTGSRSFVTGWNKQESSRIQ